MNKSLKAGLIVGGVVVALLAVAFVANAAGLTSNFASMPYRQHMQGALGGWQGNMMGGGYGTGMMDFDNMRHRNWTSSENQAPWENCPYFNRGQ